MILVVRLGCTCYRKKELFSQQDLKNEKVLKAKVRSNVYGLIVQASICRKNLRIDARSRQGTSTHDASNATTKWHLGEIEPFWISMIRCMLKEKNMLKEFWVASYLYLLNWFPTKRIEDMTPEEDLPEAESWSSPNLWKSCPCKGEGGEAHEAWRSKSKMLILGLWWELQWIHKLYNPVTQKLVMSRQVPCK